MLIDTIQPIPTTYQAQIDSTCDALAMVMTDEVHNATSEDALEIYWDVHQTPEAANSALLSGLPCIISPTLSLYAVAAR
ncbi:hypothetical protein ACVBIO_05360 [Shewanella sp. 0m-8]